MNWNGNTVPSEDPEAMAEAMLKAPQLGRVQMTYKSATLVDIKRLFES